MEKGGSNPSISANNKMGNIREERKKMRIRKITSIVQQAKEANKLIDREELIAAFIVNDGVSRRTVAEEVDAVRRFVG